MGPRATCWRPGTRSACEVGCAASGGGLRRASAGDPCRARSEAWRRRGRSAGSRPREERRGPASGKSDYAAQSSCRTSSFHRTANSVLTVCVSSGGQAQMTLISSLPGFPKPPSIQANGAAVVATRPCPPVSSAGSLPTDPSAKRFAADSVTSRSGRETESPMRRQMHALRTGVSRP